MTVKQYLKNESKKAQKHIQKTKRDDTIKYIIHTVAVFLLLFLFNKVGPEWEGTFSGMMLILIPWWFFRHLEYFNWKEDLRGEE